MESLYHRENIARLSGVAPPFLFRTRCAMLRRADCGHPVCCLADAPIPSPLLFPDPDPI